MFYKIIAKLNNATNKIKIKKYTHFAILKVECQV